MVRWDPKDPDEVLDYDIDWSTRLATGDEIATSTWTVPSGLTKGSDYVNGTKSVVWLSGGTLGETYPCLCRITTVDGRTHDQTARLGIRSK